jgi:hypothetical protein
MDEPLAKTECWIGMEEPGVKLESVDVKQWRTSPLWTTSPATHGFEDCLNSWMSITLDGVLWDSGAERTVKLL